VALFRHIPIPWVQRHTAIIPRNKDRIGENLAVFVRDKFLDAPSLVALLRRHDAAQSLADWLGAPGNSQLLGRQLARLAQAGLEMVQDRQVERLLTQTLRSVLAQVDLSRSLATVLGALTQGGRHQAVLDDVLRRIGGVLQQADTHHFIAEAIVQWLKREHPLKEKMLPTDWLGDKGPSWWPRRWKACWTTWPQPPAPHARGLRCGRAAADRAAAERPGLCRARRAGAPLSAARRSWPPICATCGAACASAWRRIWTTRNPISRASWAAWGAGWACRWRRMRRCAAP
jgi:hypothetical protein